MSEKTIVVIGGGIAGMTAALEAAETGCKAVIVEKGPSLGGRVARLNQYFPKMCPPACGMEINLRRIKNNPDIQVYTLAEVSSISGSAGNFEVTVTQKPRYVNGNCTMCGDCTAACSKEIDDEYNLGMKKIKAAYLPHKMAFPARFVIDPSIIGTDDAQKVKAACKYGAVDLDMKEQQIKVSAAAVIVATGWQPFDAAKVSYYGGGKFKNVISNVQLERISSKDGPTEGKILRPSDGKGIESIAFVQCAGSRDENFLNYCSGVCCSATIKQIGYIREQYPNAKIYVFYIDIRTPGRLEDLYMKAQEDTNTVFQKGKVAGLEEKGDKMLVKAEDTLSGLKSEQEVDLVVLATGMEPNIKETGLPGGVSLDANGFVIPGDGIFAAGAAKRPVDVATSTQDATGAALKALQCTVRK